MPNLFEYVLLLKKRIKDVYWCDVATCLLPFAIHWMQDEPRDFFKCWRLYSLSSIHEKRNLVGACSSAPSMTDITYLSKMIIIEKLKMVNAMHA